MTAKPRDLQATGALAPITQDRLLDLTIAANQIVAQTGDVNPYQVRNQLLTRKEKARVRYRNGVTLPTSAKVLMANAERRDYNHRRAVLFECSIGINDVDNGVFLPRYFNKLPGHPNAPRHDPHHHREYHLAVYDELLLVELGDTHACRATLKSLKADILSGVLPL